MTDKQLTQIRNFAKPFYRRTGRYHDWSHIVQVCHWASLFVKSYPRANSRILLAACYLHDIGRTEKDIGHALKSVRLCCPFLKKIGIASTDSEKIITTIVSHDIDQISKTNLIEAKILFDADKMEILSVAGFIRTLMFLIDERKMKLKKAVNLLSDYCNRAYQHHIFTTEAKKRLKKEQRIISNITKFILK